LEIDIVVIRKIMVPVRGDGLGEGLLDHALILAKSTNAHIDVVHAHAEPKDMLPYGTLMMTASMKQSILDAASSNASDEEHRLHAIFDSYCQRHNLTVSDDPGGGPDQISISWREEAGAQANVVSRRGRLADVIVVAKPDEDTNLGFNTLEAALMETGKLIVVAPDSPANDFGKHVAIAWNGDGRAARTITLGLGVLKNANKISIVSAEREGSDRLSGSDLIDYLAWHDIKAELVKFESGGGGAGSAILKCAADINADCLMMGGFGHSRRREIIFGGVTQHIMTNTVLPVFMAH
jgi:nucleotide-binding universal stress UspA family protein